MKIEKSFLSPQTEKESLKKLGKTRLLVWWLYVDITTCHEQDKSPYNETKSNEFPHITTRYQVTVPLSDWLEKKKVKAIIIKQKFGFPIEIYSGRKNPKIAITQ